MTVVHVPSFLYYAAKIDAVVSGSRAFAVAVPENRAEQSIALLREDAQKRNYEIYLKAGGQLEHVSPLQENWRVLASNQAHSNALLGFPPSCNVGRALRKQVVSDWVKHVPYVTVKSLPREWVTPDGSVEHGERISIELRNEMSSEREAWRAFDYLFWSKEPEGERLK